MRIEVTTNDIAGGEQDNCEQCPVARALRRQGMPNARVFTGFVRQGSDRIPLSDAVVERIETFDETGTMRPFAFDLDVPSSTTPQDGGREP
jgi:hypothetical protein